MESNFYKESKTVEQYIQMAKGHNGSEHIELLKSFLPSQAYVLEIGSGPGADFEILSKHYHVVGSDYSQEFLNRLMELFPDKTFLNLDAAELNTSLKFDAIYSNKVLHHLTDNELEKSIQRQFKLLNEGGIICHTFWKGSGTEMFNGLFVNNHTELEVNELFNQRFDTLVLKSYKEFEPNDSILFIGKRK